MIIDCISDLHGEYPELEGGDLLIVAGDLLAKNTPCGVIKFKNWLVSSSNLYKKCITIAGNHDNWIQKRFMINADRISWENKTLCYLEDSGTEFEGLKIWGSPWSLWFEGINPYRTAFTGSEEELAEKYALIPKEVDILISHNPPYMILDRVPRRGRYAGSHTLRKELDTRLNPKLFVCGHIHEGYGTVILKKPGHDILCVNASLMNEYYEAVNKPVRIEL